jgi:hypothetical protein
MTPPHLVLIEESKSLVQSSTTPPLPAKALTLSGFHEKATLVKA